MQLEPIFDALHNRIKAGFAWVTESRFLLKHWSDVDPIMQPAVFTIQGDQQAIVVTNQPTKYELNVKVYIYIHQRGQTQERTTLMNAALDAVRNALKPEYHPVKPVQNLGGLVEWARIEGDIETDEGMLGEQALAIIPIKILVVDV